MIGPFRATLVDLGGLLWKRPWRLSSTQKFRQRKRMQRVDSNIENLFSGLQANGLKTHKIDQLKYQFPKEADMDPKDKYTVFNKHAKGYRKAAHFVPKWTKLSLRNNPDNF
ncbi:DEKNAAC103707 [Brettanomyces naardenensis]|uniref:Large ribosomal subunit protein mL60 n=1 Tax=Brettanomyces naardenensis TaxID=13370 RepID=A0A448YP62_BRENA|nr:DEKNAAC103707 [Brettanomyces naardenensis]